MPEFHRLRRHLADLLERFTLGYGGRFALTFTHRFADPGILAHLSSALAVLVLVTAIAALLLEVTSGLQLKLGKLVLRSHSPMIRIEGPKCNPLAWPSVGTRSFVVS